MERGVVGVACVVPGPAQRAVVCTSASLMAIRTSPTRSLPEAAARPPATRSCTSTSPSSPGDERTTPSFAALELLCSSTVNGSDRSKRFRDDVPRSARSRRLSSAASSSASRR